MVINMRIICIIYIVYGLHILDHSNSTKKAGSNNCLKLIKVTPDSEAQRWDNENIIHKINLTEHKL